MLAIMIEQGRVFVCTCTLVFFVVAFLCNFFLMYVPVRFLVPLVLSERSKYERIHTGKLSHPLSTNALIPLQVLIHLTLIFAGHHQTD